MKNKGCLAVIGLLLFLILLAATAQGQTVDNFTYSNGPLPGNGAWTNVTGITNAMQVNTNEVEGSNPTLGGLSSSALNVAFTQPTQFRFKVTRKPLPNTSGVDPFVLFFRGNTSYGTGINGLMLAAFTSTSTTAQTATTLYSQTGTTYGTGGSRGTSLGAFNGPAGRGLNVGDTLVVNVWSWGNPFIASAWRYRGAAYSRDSLGTWTTTSADYRTGGYIWIGSESDSVMARMDDFSYQQIGTVSNSAPTLTLTYPATLDTGETGTWTATITDAGAGAGVEFLQLFINSGLQQEATSLTGTTYTITWSYKPTAAGTITAYAYGSDDSSTTVRTPGTGTYNTTVIAQPVDTVSPTPGSSFWVNGFLPSWNIDMRTVKPGTTANFGGMDPTRMNFNILTHVTIFATNLDANHNVVIGGPSANYSPDRIKPFNDYVHTKGKPVLICFGGSSTAGPAAVLQHFGTDSLARLTVHNIMRFVDSVGYDGVDFDWENGNLDTTAAGYMIRHMTDSLHARNSAYTSTGKKLFTCAILSGWGGVSYGRYASRMDQINIMTYDHQVSTGQGPGGQGVTWHINNAYGKWTSAEIRFTAARAYAATADHPKYGVGVDFNGVVYTGAYTSSTGSGSNDTGVTSPGMVLANAAAWVSRESDYNFNQLWTDYLDTIKSRGHESTQRKWDEHAKSSFWSIVKPASQYVGTPFRPWDDDKMISYSDSAGIYWIVSLAKDYNAGGIIIWNLGEGWMPATYGGIRDTMTQLVWNIVQRVIAPDTSLRTLVSLDRTTAVAGESGFSLTATCINTMIGDSLVFAGSKKPTIRNSSTSLTATISAGDIASAGNKTVSIRTGAGASSNELTFVVTAANPKPDLVSGSPSSVGQGATSYNVTWAGTAFTPGAAITFSGTGITVNGTTFNGATSLTTNLTVNIAAATGNRSVYVQNADGQRDTLVSGLAINDAPTISAAVPDSVRRGTTVSVQIQGNHFKSGSLVNLSFSPAGINYVTGVSTADSTRWAATLLVDAAAATGYRSVTMTNGDGGTVTVNNVIRVYIPGDTSGSASRPFVFMVRESGVPSTKAALDYIDWNVRTATQAGIPATNRIRQYSGGWIDANGVPSVGGFSLGLSGDAGSYTATLDGRNGVSISRLGANFVFEAPLASGSSRGSIVSGQFYDMTNGVLTIRNNSISPAWLQQLGTDKLPLGTLMAGAANTFPVSNGDGTWTDEPVPDQVPTNANNGKIAYWKGDSLVSTTADAATLEPSTPVHFVTNAELTDTMIERANDYTGGGGGSGTDTSMIYDTTSFSGTATVDTIIVPYRFIKTFNAIPLLTVKTDTISLEDSRLWYVTVGDSAFVHRGNGEGNKSGLKYAYSIKKGEYYTRPDPGDTFGVVQAGLGAWWAADWTEWESTGDTTSWGVDSSSNNLNLWSNADVARKPLWHDTEGWEIRRGSGVSVARYLTADGLASLMHGSDPGWMFNAVIKYDSSITGYPYGNFWPLWTFSEAYASGGTGNATTLQVGLMQTDQANPDWRIYYYQRPDDSAFTPKTTVASYNIASVASDTTALKTGWHILSMVRSNDTTYVFIDTVLKYQAYGAGRNLFNQINTFTINGTRGNNSSLTSSNEAGYVKIKELAFYPETDRVADHATIWTNIWRLKHKYQLP